MWRKVQTAYQLESRARSRFLLAYLLLILITLTMHFGGLRWTSQHLKKLKSPLPLGQDWGQARQLKTTLAMVRLAVRYSPWANCLRQSLTLWTLLRWQGMNTTLRIGMRLVAGIMKSHAWLEYEGQVVGDRAAVVAQYTAFNQMIEL